jgi:hypothetical protein
MSNFKMLVDGGSFFRGKRKCTMSIEAGAELEVTSNQIWASVNVDSHMDGQIEVKPQYIHNVQI